ncbi:hypothetical protein L873DRAFT_514649 [Choiromyces venosus 120613-1]|uniref:Galactose oxidase n=1 Tax=Choiromyces venosus 120613-1 TaxID=1336337 RepID=A0A3N4IVY8_9PEZI|nr:hypothetical protein L873DRAFT_514649 [Choiromyces venosus 120613-1]
MVIIKKIAYLLSIATTTVNGVWGQLDEAATFHPGGAPNKQTGSSVTKRAESGYCRIWDHSSVYYDGIIYVDRTLVTKTEGSKGAISLLQPWSLNLTSDFVAEGIDSSALIARTLNVNTDLPYTMRGAFWVSKNGTVYKYGGYYPEQGEWIFSTNVSSIAPRNGEIWELDTKTRNWTKTAQPSGESFLGARNGGYASVPDEDVGFFVGGWSSNMTDGRLKDWTHGEQLAHQSMLQWDIKGNKMFNTSTSFQAVTLSNAVHVPVGKYGLLLSLGGNQFTGSRFNWTGNGAGLKPRGFDSIDVYDFESASWSSQATTGDIPSYRHSFCTVVGTAADNSSFNVFMHGGASSNGNDGFSDTYVLSLPAFQWFRVDTTNKVDRYGVTCHLIKNKMVMIGGRGVDQPDPRKGVAMLPGACDPNGIVNIFDVNTLKWDSNFQISKLENFKVNEKITGGVGIGGGQNGGATKTEPEAGWGSGQLREKFASVVPSPTHSVKPSTSSASHTPTSAASGPVAVSGGLLSLGVSALAAMMAL